MGCLLVLGRVRLLAGAADHDSVGLDRHGHGAVAGPVLRVGGIVLDRGIEPEAVAVLAVVERALERLRLAGAGAAAPSAASAAAPLRPVVAVALRVAVAVLAVVVARAVVGVLLDRLVLGRLALGLEGLGDQGVVLGAQIRLVGLGSGHENVLTTVGRSELVLALEAADIADRDVELVGDPGVGTALAHPRADLVELRLQRSACQTAAETSNGCPLNPPPKGALLGEPYSFGRGDGSACSFSLERAIRAS